MGLRCESRRKVCVFEIVDKREMFDAKRERDKERAGSEKKDKNHPPHRHIATYHRSFQKLARSILIKERKKKQKVGFAAEQLCGMEGGREESLAHKALISLSLSFFSFVFADEAHESPIFSSADATGMKCVCV